jgi:Family of unknown function (DUF5995)
MSLLSGIQLHPKNVEQALDSLQQVAERLRARGDSRAVFPDVYGIITRIVAREVQGRTGFFQEPEWISRLAGRFAERYLETLAWSEWGGAQDCWAWHLAYSHERGGLTFPLQDAAFGISAHINFDLALGLWKTIEEFGDRSEARMARYKHDHDAVNRLLAAALPEVVECLRERYGCEVTAHFTGRLLPVTGAMVLGVLGRWREQVWKDVRALVFAPGSREQHAVLKQMHQRSGRLAEFIAVGSMAGSAWRALTGRVPHVPEAQPGARLDAVRPLAA